MLGPHRLVGLAGAAHLLEAKAAAIGVERRAPVRMARVGFGERGQGGRLVGRCPRTQIGLIGRGDGAAAQLGPLRVVVPFLVGAGRVGRLRVRQPVARIARIGRDGGRVGVQFRIGIGIGVVVRRCGLGLAAPLRGVLRPGRRLALQRRLKTDPVARQRIADEGLLKRGRHGLGGRSRGLGRERRREKRAASEYNDCGPMRRTARHEPAFLSSRPSARARTLPPADFSATLCHPGDVRNQTRSAPDARARLAPPPLASHGFSGLYVTRRGDCR